MTVNTTNYPWKFQRIGGIDQVILSSAQDIAHLDELDPKLWVALSCPASGLELDDKLLSLLDKDKDGRIRIPEVVEAVSWLKTRLTQLDTLIASPDQLPLSQINTETESGQCLLTTAQAILANIGQTDKQTINIDDLQQSATINANNLYNGDGIVPPSDKIDSDLQQFIQDALSVMGGLQDASGLTGINTEIAKTFRQFIDDWLTWQDCIATESRPLGDDTAEAWQLLLELKDKINDYFLRTELASYAPQAETMLNVDEKYIVPSDNGLLADAALADLPLSKVTANSELNLKSGLNPIWREKVLRLVSLMNPLVTCSEALSQNDWLNIQKILSPYAAMVANKPALPDLSTTVSPMLTIDALPTTRLHTILNSDIVDKFTQIADKDSATPAPAADIAEVEKLVVYHQHLYRLLMNFVSFQDFFDLDSRTAAFQTGRLFIDGRCCSLCIPVSDITKHSVLANYSELFLLYCECSRENLSADSAQQKRTIVAAMTAGDADFLLDGRNGVFVDNAGNDWDAKVVKIISKPISISQAIWDPYKRFGRFINEQINKWAGSKDSAVTDSANKSVESTETPKFDLAKSMGIFAAIGLALGALGTALATIASSLFQLHWWQLPFVFLGLFLIISGPSVILAWLKLRQRTLAPLLEASGWAINGKIKINLLLGSLLTSKAELPKNATRSLTDPMKNSYGKYWLGFIFAIIVGVGAVAGWLWYDGFFSSETTAAEQVVIDVPVDVPAEQPESVQ